MRTYPDRIILMLCDISAGGTIGDVNVTMPVPQVSMV